MPEQTSSKSSSKDNSIGHLYIFFHCKRWRSTSLLNYYACQPSCSWSSEGMNTILKDNTKVKGAEILPRWLKTGTVVGPNQKLCASCPPRAGIQPWIHILAISHIILTLVSQTVPEGRLALQSWAHSHFPDKAPDAAAVMLVACRQ